MPSFEKFFISSNVKVNSSGRISGVEISIKIFLHISLMFISL